MLTTKNFSDIVAFSRASNAWSFSSGGVLVPAAGGVPRFDYDPITLAVRGLLFEEAGTNLCLHSSNMANVVWNKSNCVISTDGRLAPDGASAAQLLTVSATAFTNIVQTVGAVASGDSRVFRIWLSAGAVDTLMLGIYDGSWTGTAHSGRIVYGPGEIAQSVGARYSVSGLSATAWTLVEICRSGFSGASAQVFLYPRNAASANAGDALYLWGADVKSGLTGTSHVPTTAAQATRAVDNAAITDLSKIGFNASAGTACIEFMVPRLPTSVSGDPGSGVISIDEPTFSNYYGIAVDTLGARFISKGANSTNSRYMAGSVSINAPMRVAFTYGGGVPDAACLNGGVVLANGTAAPVGLSEMRIGCFASNPAYLNGWIRSVRYFPRRMSDSELQNLTAL